MSDPMHVDPRAYGSVAALSLHHQALLDASMEGVYGMDVDGRCAYINQAALDLLGYAAAECVGVNMHELAHHTRLDGTPYPVAECQICQTIRTGRGAGRVEEVLWRKDGAPVLALHSCAPIRDGADIIGAVVTIVDMRERQRAAQALRESLEATRHANERAERLQCVSAALSGALTSAQVTAVIIEHALGSLAASAGIVVQAADGAGMKVAGLMGVSDAAAEALRALTVDDRAPIGRVMTSGAAVWLSGRDEILDACPLLARPTFPPVEALAAVPLSVGERIKGAFSLAFAAAHDFNTAERSFIEALAHACEQALDRARLYLAEREARGQAEEAVRQRAEFISITSHELRTPLTTIKGYNQLLARQLRRQDVAPERIVRIVGQMSSQIERLEFLIRDLLDVSRVQRGRLELRRERTDLTALARLVMERFEHAAERTKRHTLRLDAPGPIVGDWDAGRLDSMLSNVLSNALKYSPTGGEVCLTMRADGARATLTVTDEGGGIAVEDRARVFDAYQRGQRTLDSVPGAGLGLYISRHIVEAHGGEIVVASNAGPGTRVTVTLPRYSG